MKFLVSEHFGIYYLRLSDIIFGLMLPLPVSLRYINNRQDNKVEKICVEKCLSRVYIYIW